ncbi:alpha/beta fold hydrolase [Pseudomonas cremoricolorata]|uniref:Alpha/beta hydrolase n=1 Tax=Pseudomonas cremoricolorata TaxID=157783 RepID=A0A089WM16_9PSED|nr:alpha/beta hydrolase [Pseudomonas cremoricolorata]AIR90370.1 alpha/beta hydrolase [Pseudomonas cremoricolorata]
MSQQIFFAHANGFPSATYGKLFAGLAPDYQVHHLEQHAHDPRFPVDDNWQQLVEELLYHLAQQAGPVWGVGHSLGGVLHLHAALRAPQFYRGIVMLDSPLLTRVDQWMIRLAKRLGLIDRITPAGRTLGRRETFADRDAARGYFASKRLFGQFDPECLEAYLDHGLQPAEQGVRLRFDAATEISIYRTIPHASPTPARLLQLPVALVRGASSGVVRHHHGLAARGLPRGEYISVPGGHMFPLEQPTATAELLKGLLARWGQA